MQYKMRSVSLIFSMEKYMKNKTERLQATDVTFL